MKILVSTGSYPPESGGPATYSRLLAETLPTQGIGVDVVSFGQVRQYPKIVRHSAYIMKLIWHGRAADAFFAQDLVSVGLPTLVAAFVLGKPFVARVPGDYAWEQSYRFGVTDTMEDFQKGKYGFRVELLRTIQKWVANRADKILVPSDAFAAIVRGWVNNPAKVERVYNGIDIHEVAQHVSGAVRPHTIVSAGRLVPGKGFDVLIRQMKQLDGWMLEIAGEGPERHKLETIIREEKCEGKVVLLGNLDRTELLKKISTSEVFVLNTHFETFSFQIVEALALGTPVVTTRTRSIPELIEDGKNGLLVKVNDGSAFVHAIQTLASDRALRDRLVAEGKKRVQQFSIAATVEKVKRVFQEVHDAPSPLMVKRARAAKIFRYLFSGGSAAVTDLVLLYIFTDIFGMWYVLSSICAFLIAFIVSFMLQKFFTFQDHGLDGVHGQALVYLVVTSCNLGLNTAGVYAFVHYGGLHYIPAQIITSILIAVESFVVYGLLVFKKPQKKIS